MSDLIERQKALDALKSEIRSGAYVDHCGLDTAYDIIENIPSAEPERKKGEWEEGEWIMHKMLSRDYGKIYYQHDCSCNLYESPYPFCPNCGMKMKRGDR